MDGEVLVTLNYKVLFMPDAKQHLDALQDIKQMMERSSRFISLSGWSGIAAGVCALVGAAFAFKVIHPYSRELSSYDNFGGMKSEIRTQDYGYVTIDEFMGNRLFLIAIATFISALILAFVFTYLRSQKNNVPIWGSSARRLMFSAGIPMAVGGVYLFRLIQTGTFGLIAPGCLIFYGLALVNASKYTFGEIRYLGYGQLILGIINCWFVGFGLYFWAAGFGVLHIIYGAAMWYKYERNN